MANWQQKLSKSITGIKGVDRNIARLSIRIDSLDDFFGTKPPRIIELHRELIVAAPEPVNTYLVDGKNYLSSDWLCEVAFLRVKEAFEVLPDDPEITINGVVKSLAEIRPVLPGEDCSLLATCSLVARSDFFFFQTEYNVPFSSLSAATTYSVSGFFFSALSAAVLAVL